VQLGTQSIHLLCAPGHQIGQLVTQLGQRPAGSWWWWRGRKRVRVRVRVVVVVAREEEVV
jgi:hypothetical protein